MAIIYRKAFALMAEKGLTTYQIRKQKVIAERVLQKMREDQSVGIKNIDALCRVLDCQPGDLMEYIPDEEGGHE